MATTSSNNPHFGRVNFSSAYVASYQYKGVTDYSFDEWMENMFISPSENSACADQFAFMDKRSGVSFSLMMVGMPKAQIEALRSNPEACLTLLRCYFERPYYHASVSDSKINTF